MTTHTRVCIVGGGAMGVGLFYSPCAGGLDGHYPRRERRADVGVYVARGGPCVRTSLPV